MDLAYSGGSLTAPPQRGRTLPFRRSGPTALGLLLLAPDTKSILSSVSVDLTAVFTIVVLGMCIGRILTSGYRIPTLVRAPLIVFMVFLAGIIRASWGPYSQQKIISLFTITFLAAVAPIILIRTASEARVLLGTLAVVGTAVAGVALLEASAIGVGFGRASAAGSNPILTSRTIGTALICSLFFALRYRRGWLAAAAAAGSMLVTAMLSTGSRGPVASLALTLLVAGPVAVRNSLGRANTPFGGYIRVAATGAGLVGVVLIAVQLGTPYGVGRIARIDEGFETRSHLVAAALSNFEGSLIGLGWGDSIISFAEVRTYPHNMLVEVGVEAGPFALLALCWFLARALWPLRRASSTLQTSTAALALFSLLNSLVSGDINGNRIALAFAAFALATTQIERDLRRAEDGAIDP